MVVWYTGMSLYRDCLSFQTVWIPYFLMCFGRQPCRKCSHWPRFDVAGSSLLLGQGMLKGTPDWSWSSWIFELQLLLAFRSRYFNIPWSSSWINTMQYWNHQFLQCFWWYHFLHLKLTLFSWTHPHILFIQNHHKSPFGCPKFSNCFLLEVDYYLSFFFLLDVISTATLLSMNSRFEGLDRKKKKRDRWNHQSSSIQSKW